MPYLELRYSPYELGQLFLRKQYRPSSKFLECGIWQDSNEYPKYNIHFCVEIRKISIVFSCKKVPYLELCLQKKCTNKKNINATMNARIQSLAKITPSFLMFKSVQCQENYRADCKYNLLTVQIVHYKNMPIQIY